MWLRRPGSFLEGLAAPAAIGEDAEPMTAARDGQGLPMAGPKVLLARGSCAYSSSEHVRNVEVGEHRERQRQLRWT